MLAKNSLKLTNILEISPVLMILGGVILLVASKLGKYIALFLILAGIILLASSLL